MGEGRKSRKRKAEMVLQVHWQEDYHWEGGNIDTEQEKILKQKKKKKKKKKMMMMVSDVNGEASMLSSYTDHPALMLKIKEKKPKNVCRDHTVLTQKRNEKKPKDVCRDHTILKQKREKRRPKNVCRDHTVLKKTRKEKKPKNALCRGEVPWPTNVDKPGEELSNCIPSCTEHALEVKKKAKHKSHAFCKLKEHEQAQEDVDIDVHRRRTVSSEGGKPQCKKVRFSDQMSPCHCEQNVSQELCTHNSSFSKEYLASGTEQDKCTSTCNPKGKDKREKNALSSQDGSMKTDPNVDEKVLLTRKRRRVEDDEILGQRFTSEEDEILKNAVWDYIKVKGWEEKEGIDKVLNCKKHKEAYNCWGVIRLSLPNRPRKAVRSRAYRLFEEGTHLGRWSKEEEELLKRLYEMHGNQWKNLSTLIGRSQRSISNKWRSLRRPNPTGVWTWEEIEQLSDLVHKSLRLKALLGSTNEKSGHPNLRDNICWDEIACAIGTHKENSCCMKWYCNLSSSMVIDGLWASEDDRLLLKRLLESGACTEEDVDWHRLLNHRPGQTCLFRWKQMGKHLGENRTRGFLEKLDSLVRRYAPELFTCLMEDNGIRKLSV